MHIRTTVVIAVLALIVFSPIASAQQATPAAPAPALDSEGRNRVQNELLKMISRMPDTVYLQHGIDPADVGRAKTCAVQAIVVDIPEMDAEHIAQLMEHDPPQLDDVVEKWVLSSFDKTGARRRQVVEQMKKLCPDFEGAFTS